MTYFLLQETEWRSVRGKVYVALIVTSPTTDALITKWDSTVLGWRNCAIQRIKQTQQTTVISKQNTMTWKSTLKYPEKRKDAKMKFWRISQNRGTKLEEAGKDSKPTVMLRFINTCSGMTDKRKGEEIIKEYMYNGKITKIHIDFQNGEIGDRTDVVWNCQKRKNILTYMEFSTSKENVCHPNCCCQLAVTKGLEQKPNIVFKSWKCITACNL